MTMAPKNEKLAICKAANKKASDDVKRIASAVHEACQKRKQDKKCKS